MEDFDDFLDLLAVSDPKSRTIALSLTAFVGCDGAVRCFLRKDDEATSARWQEEARKGTRRRSA